MKILILVFTLLTIGLSKRHNYYYSANSTYSYPSSYSSYNSYYYSNSNSNINYEYSYYNSYYGKVSVYDWLYEYSYSYYAYSLYTIDYTFYDYDYDYYYTYDLYYQYSYNYKYSGGYRYSGYNQRREKEMVVGLTLSVLAVVVPVLCCMGCLFLGGYYLIKGRRERPAGPIFASHPQPVGMYQYPA